MTNAPLELQVSGIPIPQGSMKGFPRYIDGRLQVKIVHDNKEKLAPWRERVTAAAKVAMRFREPFDGPVELRIMFGLPRPKSAARRLAPHTKPDLSKLLRAVEDSFTDAGVWKDDSRVCRAVVEKQYSPTPGIRVLVRELSAADRPLGQRKETQ